jgi:hypothetical protein
VAATVGSVAGSAVDSITVDSITTASIASALRGPGLPGPRLRTGAGLPAADATLRGALNPNPSLLHRRLLLLARRWSDGRLLLGMGAGCAGSAPGALSTAGPLGGTMGAAT